MRWTLTGCHILALMGLSAALDHRFQVKQRPRFYGVKTGHTAAFYCIPEPAVKGTAEWYKASQYDDPWEERTLMQKSQRVNFMDKGSVQNGVLLMFRLQPDDSAVYFCKINGTPGPGAELRAARPIDPSQAQYRTSMKDGLMVLQGLLLAVCIAAILLRKRNLEQEKNESFYEEPDTDHIYQGLDVDACGGGLYEELPAYTQPEDAEAPWE